MNKIKFFFFSNTLNEIIIKNIIKFKNICIIYKPEKQVSTNDKQISEIKNFCKKNNIYFYIADNYKLAIKYNVDGIFLSSSNKNFIKPNQIKRNFDIIGSAHNTFEYSIKIQQNCRRIMLSPIFFNKKYSINKILNVVKFNLITKNWKSEVCALGGINLNNLKKIRMSKASSVAFISLINGPEIKKPIYLFG